MVRWTKNEAFAAGCIQVVGVTVVCAKAGKDKSRNEFRLPDEIN